MATTTPITDWDDAYSNGAYIPGAETYPQRWADAALSFRQAMLADNRAVLDVAYGQQAREHYDLFLPANVRSGKPGPETANGIVVFVHGGYWMNFDKSSWSHLATGALENGWQVMMPSYTLCPALSITDVTRQVASAIAHVAGDNEYPLRLAGHSAGGQLVTRMMCDHSPLSATLQQRVQKVVSISGVHDLRPLLNTRLNDTLNLSADDALRDSPALQAARPDTQLCCCVGADERPEFRRQNALLANIWQGSGAATECMEVAGRHHFNVIDELAKPDSSLVSQLLN